MKAMAEDGTQTGDLTADSADGAASTAAASTEPAAASTPETTLLSRIAGLDAKVTSLVQETAREKASREAAEQKLRDYEAGKVGADEALRAQVAAKDAELAQVRQEAALANIQAKYPETFSVLGAVAASLTADQLAASEARYSGVTETSTPSPVGTNAARQPAAGPKALGAMTLAELQAEQARLFKGSRFDTSRD